MIHGLNGPFPGCPLEQSVAEGRAIHREIHDVERGCWLSSEVLPTRFCTRQGKRVYLQNTRDITDAKQGERDLRKSEARLRAAFEQAAMGLAEVDTDGYFRRVNNKLCQILGYSEEELRALTFDEITHPEDRQMSADLSRKLLAGERSASMEKRYLRKDGSEVWARLTTSVIRTGSDSIDGFVSVIEDVTEQKNMQLHLARTDRMASVGMLAAGVAHEINNPLTYMLYNLQELQRELAESSPVGFSLQLSGG